MAKVPRTRAAAAAAAPKVPKALGHLTDDLGEHPHPVFSFSLIDRAYQGTWGWHLLDAAMADRIFQLILNVSSNKWSEITGWTGAGRKQQHFIHHFQKVSSLCPKAQELLSGPRYAELGGDVFRFHVADLERLWGFVLQGVFYAVWWDPDHEVCPLTA